MQKLLLLQGHEPGTSAVRVLILIDAKRWLSVLIKIIALESANDAEGFLFWLARAEGPAQKWTGEKKTKNGVEFVKQGYYITIRYYERFPPSCPSTFKLSSQSWTVDAEGALSLPHNRPQFAQWF